MSLEKEMIPILERILKEDKLERSERETIRKFLAKAKKGIITIEDLARLVKSVLSLHELFQQFLI